ncbi:Vgb family protein [Neobacillus sp. LXY-4]|uniref:Vgb family protein n=1 Tax=Neobacillus sp. LXY-4 TaxID=3379826 RepID=UPI003EE03C3D
MSDSLFIEDGSDNTVKRFDAISGDFYGTFVVPGSGGLNGPRGLLFDPVGNLLVSNQNVDKHKNGSVLKFNGQIGVLLGELVSSKDKNAPFSPRGTILSDDNVLFVADQINKNNKKPGEVRAYDGSTGAFLGNLDHSGFDGEFYPRAVIIGPDGLLYVSVRNNPNTIEGQLGGSVLRFNPVTRMLHDVFVESHDDLHRPEGLVFGPDGNLYITSFREDSDDTDKILIFNGEGDFLFKIDLYIAGQQPRAFAQAILFGPDGKLIVPITGPGPLTGNPLGPDTGSVRRYTVDVLNNSFEFEVIVPPATENGPLGEPWYLSFGNTNHATLAYGFEEMG